MLTPALNVAVTEYAVKIKKKKIMKKKGNHGAGRGQHGRVTAKAASGKEHAPPLVPVVANGAGKGLQQ